METISNIPDEERWFATNINYFYGHAADAETRIEYFRRNIIPTNNLSLYIEDDPEPEMAPGIANPFDYRQRPFGPAIVQLRQTHPELWGQAKAAIAQRHEVFDRFTSLLHSNQRSQALALQAEAEAAHWQQAEVLDRVFRIVAPQVEALGVDPLQLCV